MTIRIKERPIIFKGEMIRAILDGRKTVTRRAVKKFPCDCGEDWEPTNAQFEREHQYAVPVDHLWGCDCCAEGTINSRFGVPGDRLWVKEAHYLYGDWYADGLTKKTKKAKWHFRRTGAPVCYLDKPPRKIFTRKFPQLGDGFYLRSPLFMARHDSRITLEVISVGVERLQDISEEDAKAEGIECLGNPTIAFQALWQSINGPDSWELNPWVWRIEFKKVL